MKTGGALLIVIVGVIALWIVITGRLGNLQQAWGVLGGSTLPGAAAGTSNAPASNGGPTVNLNGLLQALGAASSGTSAIPSSYGASPLPIPAVALS